MEVLERDDIKKHRRSLGSDCGKRAATLILFGVFLGFFFSFAYVFIFHGF